MECTDAERTKRSEAPTLSVGSHGMFEAPTTVTTYANRSEHGQRSGGVGYANSANSIDSEDIPGHRPNPTHRL